MQNPDIQKLLSDGIAAAKAAQKNLPAQYQPGNKPIRRLSSPKDVQKEQARQLLQQVTELDDTNIQAWLWLSTVMDNFDDKRLCLSNVLLLDPTNKPALAGLAWLEKQVTQAPPTQAEAAKSHPIPEETPQPSLEQPGLDGGADAIPSEPAPSQPIGNHPGCPFCQQPIGVMDMACPHCEFPLVMDCPKCNTLMDVEWQKCNNCGFEMGDYRLGAVYFTQLAIAYQAHHRAVKASKALAIVEKTEPDQPDLYRQIGEVQAALGQTSAAISSLERAIALEPDQAGPYLALGKVLQQEGHWRQAEKIYRRAMEILPDSSETYFALGDLLLQRNRHRQARKYLQKAIDKDPQHGPAWAQMGQIYESQKKRSAAIRAYHRADLLLDPESFYGQQTHQRLNILQPKLPKQLGESWMEFSRQAAGPLLICILAVLLDSGLRPWWISWTGWLALFLAFMGTPLWISGYSLPQNPLICFLFGSRGLGRTERPIVAFLGAFFWLLAMGLILMPIGQTYPEPPQ